MHAEPQPLRSTWRSRASILMTLPHAIFLVALIVLITFILVTVRAEQFRQRKSDSLAKRCAFVYLISINHTNIDNLSTSLRSLNANFKFDFDYKIVIVHDDVPPVMQGKLQAVSEAPLDFVPVVLGLSARDYGRSTNANGILSGRANTSSSDNDINATLYVQNGNGLITEQDTQDAHRSNVASRDNADDSFVTKNISSSFDSDDRSGLPLIQDERLLWQNMNRFWFYTACLNDPTRTSPFLDIDYIVRLDSDWHFGAPVTRDFVRDFVMSGAQYGYFERVGKDCAVNSTLSLKQLATSYVELNGITPRSMELWSNVVKSTPSAGEVTCLPLFYPHLEVINLRFFRSHSGIQDLLRVVEANGGIYTHGWKDSVLRFITVSLYAAREKVVRYDSNALPYRFIASSTQ